MSRKPTAPSTTEAPRVRMSEDEEVLGIMFRNKTRGGKVMYRLSLKPGVTLTSETNAVGFECRMANSEGIVIRQGRNNDPWTPQA